MNGILHVIETANNVCFKTMNSSTELTFGKAYCLIGNCNFHCVWFFFLPFTVSALNMLNQYKPITGVKRNKQPTSLSAVRGLSCDSLGINNSKLYMVGFCFVFCLFRKKKKQPPTNCDLHHDFHHSIIYLNKREKEDQ